MGTPDRATYADSGVNLEKAESFLDAMLHWIRKTEDIPGQAHRSLIPNGYYASVVDLGGDLALALTTDGVGTKILVAEMAGDFSGIGIDCIGMNVNDLICVGARPISMVDYLAIQDPPIEVGEQIGRSLYTGAKEAGISIPGGELAQLPEMIRGVHEGAGIDLAGAAFGVLSKNEINYGQGLEAGDVLIGIASNGVHSNGFTLARKVFFDLAGLRPKDRVPELDGKTVAEELLRPTAIYVKHLALLRERNLAPKAAMHITGGGFLNLLRASSEGVRYVIETLPEPQPVFRFIQDRGRVSAAEMHRVFNMGIGMVVVVAKEQEAATIEILKQLDSPYAVTRIGCLEAAQNKSVAIPGLGLVSHGSVFQPMG